MMECSHDILDVKPPHDRNPRQPHRFPAPVPRRRQRPPAPNQAVAHDLVEIDEASLPQLDKGTPSGPGRSPEGKMPVAGAVELGNFAVRNTAATAVVKADGWREAAARCLGTATGPLSATGSPVKFSLGSTPRSATSRAGLGASATGCAPNLTPAAS